MEKMKIFVANHSDPFVIVKGWDIETDLTPEQVIDEQTTFITEAGLDTETHYIHSIERRDNQ